MCSFGMYWEKVEEEKVEDFTMKEQATPAIEIPADH